MRVEIRDQGGKTQVKDAFVIFLASDEKKFPHSLEGLPAEIQADFEKFAPAGAAGEGALFTMPLAGGVPARRVYAFGVGKSLEITARKARTLLRTAVKSLKKTHEISAVFDLPFALKDMSPEEGRQFLLRSLILSTYSFRRYKSEGEDGKQPDIETVAVNPESGLFAAITAGDLEKEIAQAQAIASVCRLVRDLGNTPSSDLGPRDFARIAAEEAHSRGLEITVLDRQGIEKERMGGLLAVSRGSAEEPRFVILKYHGGRPGEKPIVLAGKGVTFDSGGISIKPSEKMGEMKWDMMGAATALGAVLAAADVKLPMNVVGLMTLAENMPSGTAYKPGDIVRFRSGKTAEIDNTDAEGRVILADALDFAKDLGPAAVLDYATLTGAAVVALGFEAAALFTTDDGLAKSLISAGERTGERLWRLPLWDEYKEYIRSEWADVKNTGGRWGGSINGAMFLKEFAPEDAPWAHIDIAPTANYEKEHAGYPPGSTSYGVALTLLWMLDRARGEGRLAGV